jgi:hypothetical protein
MPLMSFSRLDWLSRADAELSMKREKGRRLRLCDRARGVFDP